MTVGIKCPICGSSTRLRTSKKDGSKFHVCVNWPECKGKVEWEDEYEDISPASKATHHVSRQRREPKRNFATEPVKNPLLVIILVIIGICLVMYFVFAK